MRVIFRGEEREVKGPLTVRELLEELGLLPESAVVLRNGELVTEDEVLRDEDEVRVISAISGGRKRRADCNFSLRGASK